MLSLKRYHEAPFWHPFLCGGFPAFGDTETASNFISPYLPLYLLADIRNRDSARGAGRRADRARR